MSRDQVFATIEFVNDVIRMTIGEYYNDNFYVFDTFVCKCNGLSDCNIIDEENVKATIKRMLDSACEKTEKEVKEIILCLPSSKLIINDFSTTSPVTGKNHWIGQYDINEAYRTASKIRHQDDEIVINIVPIEYVLDDGQKMDIEPIKYKSTTFKTLFNVLMLPKDVHDTYIKMIKDCNIKSSKYHLDTDCLYAGVYDEDDISSSILNFNKYSTDLLIYKKGKLLNKISIPVGTSLIEQEIEEQLLIKNYKDIENLLYNVGSCINTNNNYLSVCKNSENKYISEQKLNQLIELNMTVILNQLINKAKDVTTLSDLDVTIVGIGSKIKGIDILLKSLCGCNASYYISNTLGLNDASYCQTIGLIKFNYKKISQNKYINLQNNSYNDIIATKEQSSKFDKFILDDDDLD